jgi:hypothetical protein
MFNLSLNFLLILIKIEHITSIRNVRRMLGVGEYWVEVGRRRSELKEREMPVEEGRPPNAGTKREGKRERKRGFEILWEIHFPHTCFIVFTLKKNKNKKQNKTKIELGAEQDITK